jgi:hypothetical protein
LHDASDAPRSLVRHHDPAWLGEGHFPSLLQSIVAADSQQPVMYVPQERSPDMWSS